MNYINGSELAEKRFIKLENGDLREVSTAHFIPAKGEIFFYLTAHGKIKNQWNNNLEETKWFLQHNPVFRCKEDCEEYKHFLETLGKYTFEPDWNNKEQDKWKLYFSHECLGISLGFSHVIQSQGVFFESEEKVKAFVDKVGKEAIERFMFDYWR